MTKRSATSANASDQVTYPPAKHLECDPATIRGLCRSFPLAHFITVDEHGMPRASRIPVVVDDDGESIVKARGHLNGVNPQSNSINGAPCVIAFSGPDAYISPFWRTSSDRGPTWDYSSVNLHGRISKRDDIEFFKALVGDLASLGEAREPDLARGERWQLSNVSNAYVARLRRHVVAFEVKIERCEAISKFHQDFPREDALSVAHVLGQSSQQSSRLVAAAITDRARGPECPPCRQLTMRLDNNRTSNLAKRCDVA